jgi:ABC-type lipoprotein export system ATPase subunit
MFEFPGSKFCKVDLHIHTPASTDDYKEVITPEDIVSKAIETGLCAIGITDHNTILWNDLIRKAASSTNLIIFPGFELNAKGGHVLALFDPDTPMDVLETALIEAGIPKPSFGDNKALGHDMPIAIEAITRNGGLVVAAHSDAPKGFLKTSGQGVTRIQTFMNPDLSAIELVSLERRTDYATGKISGYERPMACIQGSDAHSIAEIGSKPIFLRMHRINIEGLRHVFSEPTLRIRFPEDAIPTIYPLIESINVDRGFLAEQLISFNPSLNCLVGGAGSGKSTIIEFIRFALDQGSQFPDIAKDASGKLKDLAGIGSTIRLKVRLESGDLVEIGRVFDGETNPITLLDITTNQEIEIKDIHSLFPIHAFSQGEVVAISRSPLAQLDLIDSHIDIAQYQEENRSAYESLNRQVDNLVELESILRNRDRIKNEIVSFEVQAKLLTSELQKLEESQHSDVVTSHQFWIAEEAYFGSLLDSVEITKNAIETGIEAIELPITSVPIPNEITPNLDQLNQCHQLTLQMEQSRTDAKNLLKKQLATVEKKIRSISDAWKKKFREHNSQYNKLKITQKSIRIKKINDELSNIRKKLQKARIELRKIDSANLEFGRKLKERQRLLNQIQDRKDRIFALRDKKCKEFVKQIGDTIALSLEPDGNRNQYDELITQIMHGTYATRSIPTMIASTIHPSDLVKLIRTNNIIKIGQLSGIGDKWAQTLIEQVKAHPEFSYQIEAVAIEDFLEIALKIEVGNYRPLEKLSTGQKATVIVLLTMVEGNRPIIFDQPEDALYTPFVYTEVVKSLRREKDLRQFILATHNPNIAVGGDTDLGIVLKSTSSNATVDSAGGLDDRETQSLLLLHLEGGEQALNTRHIKFGLNKKLNKDKVKKS